LFGSYCEPAAEESLEIDGNPHEQEEGAAEAATEDVHGAVVPLKRSYLNAPGDSSDAPALKKSKIEGRKPCTVGVKLAPLLFAYPGGRLLTPTRALDTAINSMSLPKEVGSACLSSFVGKGVTEEVRVVVKVPQELAKEMAADGSAKLQLRDACLDARGAEGASAAGTAIAAASTGGVAAISPGKAVAAAAAGGSSAAAGGVAATTAGPSAAGPTAGAAATAADAATVGATAAGALLCPGSETVAVHEFDAVLRSRPQDGQLRLARLTSHMRPFITWRLFVVAVS
jgi:hypothetical protein